MKSSMVQNADYIDNKEKGSYSDLQVLQSNAGFYIGTIFTDAEGWQEPGSRDSDYFPTRAAAAIALEAIKSGEMETRQTP